MPINIHTGMPLPKKKPAKTLQQIAQEHLAQGGLLAPAPQAPEVVWGNTAWAFTQAPEPVAPWTAQQGLQAAAAAQMDAVDMGVDGLDMNANVAGGGGLADGKMFTINTAPSYARESKPMKKSKDGNQWFERLNKYPKDQQAGTTIPERYCAVTEKTHPKSLNCDWTWLEPYWVYNIYLDNFMGHCCQCSKTYLWMRSDETARMYNENRVSIEWMKENGYSEMEGRYNGYWWKKSESFEYWGYDPAGKLRPYWAPKGTERSFPVCPITKKRYHQAEFVSVQTVDGSTGVSQEALRMSKDIHTCTSCGHIFKEPLIVMWQPAAGEFKKPFCVKCKGKMMEKDIIRHYDDSNFLPAIPDIIVPKLGGKPNKQQKLRLFGVELEVGFNADKERAEVALDVWDTLGRDFCYMKHDGSITKLQFDDGYKVKNPMKAGFEIVSAPAGIDVHRERWKALANVRDFKILRAWDADSCGLHVHVNRKSLTWLQIGRMLVFMNHPNNRYFIEVVAGRNSNYYTRYIKKEFTDCGVVDECKYMALRTNKPETIEFRIFRSTINYRHIMRDIEFAEAVCDFCAPCANSLRDIMDYRKFIAFVGAFKTSYPMLAQWLQTIELIAKKPLPDPKYKQESSLDEALSDVVKEQLAGVMKAMAAPTMTLDDLTPEPKKKEAKAKPVEMDIEVEEEFEP